MQKSSEITKSKCSCAWNAPPSLPTWWLLRQHPLSGQGQCVGLPCESEMERPKFLFLSWEKSSNSACYWWISRRLFIFLRLRRGCSLIILIGCFPSSKGAPCRICLGLTSTKLPFWQAAAPVRKSTSSTNLRWLTVSLIFTKRNFTKYLKKKQIFNLHLLVKPKINETFANQPTPPAWPPKPE